MKSHILGVGENKEKHTALIYRKKVDEIIKEFELVGKVVLTTSNNENKMKAAFNDEEMFGCLALFLWPG